MINSNNLVNITSINYSVCKHCLSTNVLHNAYLNEYIQLKKLFEWSYVASDINYMPFRANLVDRS